MSAYMHLQAYNPPQFQTIASIS